MDADAGIFSEFIHVPRRNNFWIYEWREFYEALAYAPQTTSYDYNSPLDESGVPSAKFAGFRDVIAKRIARGNRFLLCRTRFQGLKFPDITLGEMSPLWANLGTAVETQTPRPMETFGQSYGYILYRTPGAEVGEWAAEHSRGCETMRKFIWMEKFWEAQTGAAEQNL